MALLRALFLSDDRANHAGRTLLVTFNRSLLAYLRHIISGNRDSLHIRNYHHFARGYLNSRGQMHYDCILDDGPRRGLIEEAVAAVRRQRSDPILSRDIGFFVAELDWISQHGIHDVRTYMETDRVGRRQALPPAARPTIWEVRDTYEAIRSARGQRYDWHDLASSVRHQLVADASERLYRHVVIDEGQDFSPEMLRSLVEAVGVDGSVTFFGDVAQQIYGRGVSWRSAGMRVKKVWEFKRNYRNSPQVARLGLAIADMPYFDGQEDIVAPDQFADDGPPPTLVEFDDVVAERQWAIEQSVQLGRVGATAVLFRREDAAQAFAAVCPGANLLDRTTPTWSPGPGIWVGTVHAAKGFEFQSVLICGLADGDWPDPEACRSTGEEEARAMDGRLLYVAVTRARQNLIMTVPDAVTSLLPDNDGHWLELRP